MRVLIGSSSLRMKFHWEEFARHLSALGAECKVVNAADFVGFPSKRAHKWMPSKRRFNALVRDFRPDAILADGLRYFGLAVLKSGIPLIVALRGDFWSESQMARETLYKSFPQNIVHYVGVRMGKKILREARVVMPISAYLDGVVREKLPAKPTYVMGHAMDSSEWHPEKGMTLEHPCVGLVQNAVFWSKAKEMLVLKDVLDRLPDVTFYWAGDGQHVDDIMGKLGKYPNFKRVGSLGYPAGVRRFLTEIDIYALVSGLDTYSRSAREAMMTGTPTLATNIGGLPEIIKDGESGMLVDAGDADGYAKKISYLLENPAAARRMAECGKKTARQNVSGSEIARAFHEYVRTELLSRDSES